MNLTAIDPALGRMGEFSKATGNVTAPVQKLRDSTIFRDGVLPARIKSLAALLWAVSSRCEPCIKFYAQKARELGATDTELGEMLAIAPAMGACVAEMWALRAFAAAQDSTEANKSTEGDCNDEICCS
ncbi:MAG: carboxymuconolactone decarboxylase family protein [Nevskiales bacterium]